MASHQRENARKEKKQLNEARIKRIVVIVLVLVIAALAVMKVAEVDFVSLKNRFFDENGKFTMSMTTEEYAYPYNLDSSTNVKMKAINERLVIMTDLSCTVLNPTDAKPIYTFNHGFSNPVMKNAGGYIATFDQGATRFRLDNTNENVYESTVNGKIICLDVSKNGNIIYSFRNADNETYVTVINSSLKKLMNFRVKNAYVVSVAIDASGKRYAYVTVNSKGAKLVTTVHTINLNDATDRATFDFSESNILDLKYASSSELYYVATDRVDVIKSQKKQKEVLKHGSTNAVCFNYTEDGELVYIYSKYADAKENYAAYITSSGKVKTEVKLNKKPKYVAAGDGMTVLFSDKAVTYSLSKGEKIETIKCGDGVDSICKMSSKIFAARHQVVDVLN